ncbi:MAG: YihA family ribosome biogenesis GTP-binding protein [Rickettsiaceae bacterium H1]|nr:YihA family ribosome biogenesis GTP-binding protein [Rickettsiaceae bacterium H1]
MINEKFRRCKFVSGAVNVKQIPNSILNEVAFAGKSNVGKSSLLNALTLQKSLARISKTPGRTQQINFFSIENFITLVDLPGYGYAKASKSKINEWSELIAFYVSSRENLRQLFLLIDARRGVQENDLAVIEWLNSYSIDYTIVLTKVDKMKEIETVKENIIKESGIKSEIIATSTKTGAGISKMRNFISLFTR